MKAAIDHARDRGQRDERNQKLVEKQRALQTVREAEPAVRDRRRGVKRTIGKGAKTVIKRYTGSR